MIDVLIWIIVLLPPLDWLAAVILTHLSRNHPQVLALRERAIAAIIGAVVASLAGVVGWAYFGFIKLPSGSSVFVLAFVLILVSAPSLYWLLLLATGRWRLKGGAE